MYIIAYNHVDNGCMHQSYYTVILVVHCDKLNEEHFMGKIRKEGVHSHH